MLTIDIVGAYGGWDTCCLVARRNFNTLLLHPLSACAQNMEHSNSGMSDTNARSPADTPKAIGESSAVLFPPLLLEACTDTTSGLALSFADCALSTYCETDGLGEAPTFFTRMSAALFAALSPYAKAILHYAHSSACSSTLCIVLPPLEAPLVTLVISVSFTALSSSIAI